MIFTMSAKVPITIAKKMRKFFRPRKTCTSKVIRKLSYVKMRINRHSLINVNITARH